MATDNDEIRVPLARFVQNRLFRRPLDDFRRYVHGTLAVTQLSRCPLDESRPPLAQLVEKVLANRKAHEKRVGHFRCSRVDCVEHFDRGTLRPGPCSDGPNGRVATGRAVDR